MQVIFCNIISSGGKELKYWTLTSNLVVEVEVQAAELGRSAWAGEDTHLTPIKIVWFIYVIALSFKTSTLFTSHLISNTAALSSFLHWHTNWGVLLMVFHQLLIFFQKVCLHIGSFSIVSPYLLPTPFLHTRACCQTYWLEERWALQDQPRVGRTSLQQNQKNQFNLSLSLFVFIKAKFQFFKKQKNNWNNSMRQTNKHVDGWKRLVISTNGFRNRVSYMSLLMCQFMPERITTYLAPLRYQPSGDNLKLH